MTNENHFNVNGNVKISPSTKDLIWIRNLDSEIIEPIYKTLDFKRIYKINNLIGSFKLIRNEFNKENLNFINNYWELYSFNTPIWNKRFINYNAKLDNYKIKFDSDDNLENFYSKYGYEPDEKTKEIQYKSIGHISKISKKIWYETPVRIENLEYK